MRVFIMGVILIIKTMLKRKNLYTIAAFQRYQLSKILEFVVSSDEDGMNGLKQ